jgi:GrpB-like predicted nucleotidyltransferase (UPF0157 family)
MSEVIVRPYDPSWAIQFEELKNFLWPHVKDFAVSIEHVGSTAVPGLVAKPVIDIDIVIPDKSFLPLAVERLTALGYEHKGDLGIVDRDAFRAPQHPIKHHLYVCPQDSLSLKNHLFLRDTLRSFTELRDEYGTLKNHLASKHSDSIDDYIEGKTDFILKILKKNGLGSGHLEEIRLANRSPQNRR